MRKAQIALIFRERLLAPSETFIVEQARSLRRYHPILAGLRRAAPSLKHPLAEILLSDGSGSIDKIAANLFRRFAIAPRFTSIIREQEPKVIHAHFAVDAAQAIPIARKLDIPLIVSLHGYDVTSSDESLMGSFSGRHYIANRHSLFQESSMFLCVSNCIRDAALRKGFPESKLRVHYTGIDCQRFRPAPMERDPKLILFVGRLVEKKGCDYLLQAMKFVQLGDTAARLEIIGDGPLRAELEERASALGIAAQFRGVQPTGEVLRSMRRARILCNPSITASSGDMEGFGMVFAEAQAVGTPVVSFKNAAIPEAVAHGATGLLCTEGSVHELADALTVLLSDDRLWFSMSEQSVLWINRNFDIVKQSVKLEGIYNSCLAARN